MKSDKLTQVVVYDGTRIDEIISFVKTVHFDVTMSLFYGTF